MAVDLGGRWPSRLGGQAHAWRAAPADRPATPTIGACAVARGQGAWRFHRAVDFEVRRGRHAGPLRRALAPLLRVEGGMRPGLERPGARAPSHPTRRTGHRALEALYLARHKKQPAQWARLSPAWMRAASGASPRVAGPGHPGGTRRSSPLATNMTSSRPWGLLPCPRSARLWVCTSCGSRATSMRSMSLLSGARCCGIAAAPSSCYGTAVHFPEGRRLRRCAGPSLACTWKHCQPMPRHSTPLSRSGTISKAIRRTVGRDTSAIFAVACMPTRAEYGVHKPNSAPPSSALRCLLQRGSRIMTYAKHNKSECILLSKLPS